MPLSIIYWIIELIWKWFEVLYGGKTALRCSSGRVRSFVMIMMAVGVTVEAARCMLAFSHWLIVDDRQMHVNCAIVIGT